MDRTELQKLRDLPIEGVAERLGLDVRRHKALCPFHDDRHPSLSFNVRKNTFRCFVCGASGGTIDLAMKLIPASYGSGFREACRWLADENNVILTDYKPREKTPPKAFDASRYARYFERPWLSDAARSFLFDERGLDPRVIRWCRLNSFRDNIGINWLQTPYFDQKGNLIGVQSRNLDYKRQDTADGESCQPRFRFPFNSRCSIYNLPVLSMLRPSEPLYITEGCSDCWAMLSAGHKAIAIPSATLLSKADIKILSDLRMRLSTTFHMFPDQDVPGERLFLQLKEKLEDRLIRHQLPPGCKDFSEYYLMKKNSEG